MADLVGSECSENHGGRAEAWGHREAAGSRQQGFSGEKGPL